MTVIPGKTRNQIRKAMKRGLETRHVKTKESLDDFFSLYVLSNERWRRKRLKYSYNFFRQFWTKDYISVNMAYKDNIPAAGIILLNQLGRCQYWFGAMNKSFGHLRPNHLLFSMAIEDAVKRGLTMFDFGPSGAAGELSGVVRFKESFGASARAFNIYYSGNLFIYSALRVFLNFRSQHET
jgi:lipid II:glycine glycyltransferase (peptidoglycan interpeptide bridge formation enzyme)